MTIQQEIESLKERIKGLEEKLQAEKPQAEGYSRDFPTEGEHWFIWCHGVDFKVVRDKAVNADQLANGNAFATKKEAERHLEMVLDILNPRKREEGWAWSVVTNAPYCAQGGEYVWDEEDWFRYNTSGIWATKEEAEEKGPDWVKRWCGK